MANEDEELGWEECVRNAFQRTRQGLEQFAQSRSVDYQLPRKLARKWA